MSDKWWLKISCPVCPCSKRSEPCYWPHNGCRKIDSEDNNLKIDIDGNICCNGCPMKIPFKDLKFGCNNHDFQKPENLGNVLEVLQVMINESKSISDQKKFSRMVANLSLMYANN